MANAKWLIFMLRMLVPFFLPVKAVFETGPASPRAFRRALRRPGRAGNLKPHEASGFLIKSPQAVWAFFRTGVRRSYFELNG